MDQPNLSASASVVEPLQAVPVILELGNPTNGTSDGLVCYDFAVTYAQAGLLVVQTAFEVKTDFCKNVSGVLSIELESAGGRVVASEQVSGHRWEALPGAIIASGDSLVIVAQGPLTADELDSEVSSNLGGVQGASPFTPYSGDFEGCDFT